MATLVACSPLGHVAVAGPETTGTIRVQIATPADLPSAAVVEIVATDDPTFVRSAEARAPHEPVVFSRLPPGSYHLTAQLQNFQRADIDVRLQSATLVEFVVDFCDERSAICAESLVRIAHTVDVGYGYAFDDAVLSSFPGDDALSSVVETTIGSAIVDRMSTGGLWVGEPALIGNSGGSWRQTSLMLGDADVTDPVRIGTSLARFDQQSTAGVHALTAMLPASLGGAGPVLMSVPTTPPRSWQTALEFDALPPSLQSDNARDGAPSIARYATHQDVGAKLGGSLGRRGGIFVSTRAVATDRIERDDPNRLGTEIASLYASSNIALTRNSRLRIISTQHRAGMPYSGRARFPDRDVRENDTVATAQVTLDKWADNSTTWSVSSAYVRARFGPAVATSNVAVPGAGATVERLRDGPVPSLFDPAGTRARFMLAADAESALTKHNHRHSVAFGGSVSRSTSATRMTLSPAVAELVDGLPGRIWEYRDSGADSQHAATETAAYVADRITLPRRVLFDGGARFEAARGSAQGAANRISWASLVPRLGVHWTVDGRDRLTVFGGYSRYMHRLALDYFSFGDPAATSGQAFLWQDGNGDRGLQEGERGPLIAALGPGGTLNGIDPHLQRPYTDEIVVGVEGRLGSWSVRVAGIERRERRLIASVNTGVTADDYVARYVLDHGERYVEAEDDRPLVVYDRTPSSFGQDRYVLMNPAAHTAYYKGVEVTLERRSGRVWKTRFDGTAFHGEALGANRGYRASENDQGLIGELFENPNAMTYARGHNFSDRGYVMKLWGTYLAPRRSVFGVIARYQDGQSFSRVVIVPDLNQGPEAVSAYRRGRTRFTFTFSLDARFEKSVRVGRADVSAVVTVFNALNTSNEVEENVVTSPSFRTSTFVQPPRAVQLGARLRF